MAGEEAGRGKIVNDKIFHRGSIILDSSLSLRLQAITHVEEGGLRKLKVARYRMCYLTEKQTSNRL